MRLKRFSRRLPAADRRCGRGLIVVGLRILASLVRRQFKGTSVATTRLCPQRAVKILADLKTPLGLQLYRYGTCDPELALLAAVLRPGDVFVDGGANIGIFTVIAAATVGPSGRVIACEPSSSTYELLRRNVALNGYSWVETHQVALGERVTTAVFYSFEAGSGLSSLAPHKPDTAELSSVPMVTLDGLLEEAAVSPQLIKLDLEGSEGRALAGATRLLETSKPDWIIEVEPAHLARQGSSLSELDLLFRRHGYRAF